MANTFPQTTIKTRIGYWE